MPSAENALLQYEAGQTPVAMVELTDQGDHLDFRSADTMWSNKSGYTPDIKPDGVESGLVVTPAASETNDYVDVSAGYVSLVGVSTSVSLAADETITRATSTDTHLISSVQITSVGAVAIIAGTDGTSFVETRGSAGGPPYIVVGSIEIAQVRLIGDSGTPKAIESAEIFMTPGNHREIWNFPSFEQDRFKVENGVLGLAGVDFSSALPLSHTADVTKAVYAAYYTPIFANIPDAYDFKGAALAHSVTSQQVYGRTVGTPNSTLNQGSFNCLLQDGISDGILQQADADLFFRFYQDRLKTPYMLSQGKLGVDTDYPADTNIMATCTISAGEKAERVTG